MLSWVRLFVTTRTIESLKFSGQNTEVGSHSLLQGIFPTQRSNPGLLHYRQILFQLATRKSQEYWSWQPIPSPGDLPNPTIEPRSPTLQADSLPYKPPGKGANFEQTPRDDDRHHGQGSLACCSPCAHKESDMTEQLNNPYLWCFLLVIFYPVTPYSALWPLFLFVLSWIQSLQLTIVVTTFIMMVLNKLCLTVLASIMNIFFSRRNVKETKKIFFAYFECKFVEFICY